MDTKQLNETSKFLSYVLRHEPHAIGLQLDSEGWADIESLIAGAAKDGRTLDIALIQAVVSSSDKKRFSISDDGLRIRAVQGHSTTNVSIQHVEKEPPEFLYHNKKGSDLFSRVSPWPPLPSLLYQQTNNPLHLVHKTVRTQKINLSPFCFVLFASAYISRNQERALYHVLSDIRDKL